MKENGNPDSQPIIVAALFRAVAKGVREEVPSAQITVEAGFAGDIHTKKEKRQVVLFSEEGRRELEELSGEGKKGLCFERFKENILTRNGRLEGCRTEDFIQAGKAGLTVSGGQKKCYPECPFVQAKLPVKTFCPLQREVVFTDCVESGTVKRHDPIRITPAAARKMPPGE